MLDSKIFRANDIRGKYPSEINEAVVFDIVSGVRNIFLKTVVVGHDARLSSSSLYKVVLEALGQDGKLKVFAAGLITSPAIYFLVNNLKANGGIMVTASHNPSEYNGLKIMGKNAAPISGLDILNKILLFPQAASFAPAGKLASSSPCSRAHNFKKIMCSDRARSVARLSDEKQNVYLKSYVNFLKKYLKVTKKLKVVFDCSDGTTGIVLKELFKNPALTDKYGASNKKVEAIFLNTEPDGNFPGHGPNPLKSGALNQIKKEVVKQKADLGIIFDGDGDRVFFIDNLGREIDPDVICFILMKRFKSPYVVSTINSWRVKKIKRTIVAKVGHLFMKQAMRKNKANLGMERSGHYYFKDFFYCDGGIFTALQIINFIGGLNQKISDCVEDLPKYFQIPETNFEIKNQQWAENKISEAEALYKKSAVAIKKEDGLLMEFSDWWFSLRLSNSEYLLRLNMEADNKNLLEEKFKEVKRLLSK